MDYNNNVSSGGGSVTVKPGSEATRKHLLDVVAPSSDSGGTFTITIERGTDSEENKATENWELTMLGTALLDVSGDFTIPSNGPSAAGGGATSAVMTISASGAVLTGSGGSSLSPTLTMIVNPSTAAVYRWSVEEHTTISPTIGTTDFFGTMPGTQGVLIN